MEFTTSREELKDLVAHVLHLISSTPGHKRLSEMISTWMTSAMYRNTQLELPLDDALHNLEEVNQMLSGSIDRWAREEREKGLVQGLEQGRQENSKEIALDMLKNNVEEAFILRFAKVVHGQ